MTPARPLIVEKSDLLWLAGLLEGDGCFSGLNNNRSVISIQMIDEDTVIRAASILGVSYRESSQRKGHRRIYRAQLCGRRALAWMEVLIPYLGVRRSERVASLIAQSKQKKPRHMDRLASANWEGHETLSYRELGKLYGVSHETIRRSIMGLDRNGKPRVKGKPRRDLVVEVHGDADEIHWLAGYLDAEGSFMKGPPSRPNSPVISLQTTDQDVANKYASLVARSVCSHVPAGGAYKRVYLVSVRGRAAMDWMRALWPLMSRRRQMQIDIALSSYEPSKRAKAIDSRKKLTDANVLSIPAGIEQGKSLRQIARSYGVHHETIRHAITNRLPLLIGTGSTG